MPRRRTKKNTQPKTFKRKVVKERPLASPTKVTPREAVMAVVYRTLKTAPLNLNDVADIGGFNMTEKRAEMCERYFANFLDKMSERFENNLRKKGHDALVDKIVPPTPFAEEYVDTDEIKNDIDYLGQE